MRKIDQNIPFADFSKDQDWNLRGLWPCRWICGSDLGEPPFVVAYRKKFVLKEDITATVYVTADERYELFLDGEFKGRGSEYGDADNWYYETYDFDLKKGSHTFVAKVWSLGSMAPYAQMSVAHGFLFAAEEDFFKVLATGITDWEYKKIEGIEFVDPRPAFGTGANLVIDGSKFPWGFEKGVGDDWQLAQISHQGTNGKFRNEISPSHLMRSGYLPQMIEREIDSCVVKYVSDSVSIDTLKKTAINSKNNLADEQNQWDLIRQKNTVTIPPKTKRRIIYDIEDYYCAYPEITTSGGKGSKVSLRWAESLYAKPIPDIEDGRDQIGHEKGNRNEIEGKYFYGVGDLFKPDGGDNRVFKTLWWQAGRYLELYVETAEAPLTIESFKLRETRYPLEMESVFQCDDSRVNDIIPIAFRSLQMCTHEVVFDCPYYEQIMYAGDGRLELLTMLVSTGDDRMVKKCIELFDISRVPSGLTQSRYPSRVRQIIGPFSLFWVGMVYDYAFWRDDKKFISERMLGVRSVLESFLAMRNSQGLIENHHGWNFIDWVPDWRDGEHPGSEYGPSGIINWQFVYILNLVSQLEDWLGETEMSQRWKRVACEIAGSLQKCFWDKNQNLFADDIHKKYFSEHAQCFAVLSGLLKKDQLNAISQSLSSCQDMQRTTISYTHYLFETYRKLDLIDLFYDRMNLWFDMKERGFRTMPEQPEPSRSDCHGWGAHPVYHFFATILGIRPAKLGFEFVNISPKPGLLKDINARLVHPKGWIEVEFKKEGNNLSGYVTLPVGVDGIFNYGDFSKNLVGGKKESICVALPCSSLK